MTQNSHKIRYFCLLSLRPKLHYKFDFKIAVELIEVNRGVYLTIKLVFKSTASVFLEKVGCTQRVSDSEIGVLYIL